MMHVDYFQILIKTKVDFVVYFLSSIVIEGARTLFLFFKCILKKNKKQLKRIKSKKSEELKRVYHLNKDYLFKANLVMLK